MPLIIFFAIYRTSACNEHSFYSVNWLPHCAILCIVVVLISEDTCSWRFQKPLQRGSSGGMFCFGHAGLCVRGYRGCLFSRASNDKTGPVNRSVGPCTVSGCPAATGHARRRLLPETDFDTPSKLIHRNSAVSRYQPTSPHASTSACSTLLASNNLY